MSIALNLATAVVSVIILHLLFGSGISEELRDVIFLFCTYMLCDIHRNTGRK